MLQEGRGKFSSGFMFILAAAASAVGLGDLWRFPSVAYGNGGGAFLIAYVLIVFTMGLVLMATEVAFGRRTGLSGSSAFSKIDERWKFLGTITTATPVLIGPFYCTIGGWSFYYVFKYLTGGSSALTDSLFFETFRASGFAGVLDNPLVWFFIFLFVTFVINRLGVNKGIEKSSLVMIPALVLLLICVTIVAMMNGASDYVVEYVGFDLSDFTPDLILSALVQAFFSISLCFGLLITYGSYMKKEVDIVKSSVLVLAIDVAVSLIAGLLIVTSVFAFGHFSTVPDGSGLLFTVMPSVFDMMGPIGGTVGLAFYVLVAFAAVSSAVSLAEIPIASISDSFKMSRKKAWTITVLLFVTIGTLTTLGYGPMKYDWVPMGGFLELIDFATNTLLIPIIGILTCIFVGFVLKPKAIVDEIEESGRFRIRRFYGPLVKFVFPAVLVVILAAGLLGH